MGGQKRDATVPNTSEAGLLLGTAENPVENTAGTFIVTGTVGDLSLLIGTGRDPGAGHRVGKGSVVAGRRRRTEGVRGLGQAESAAIPPSEAGSLRILLWTETETET